MDSIDVKTWESHRKVICDTHAKEVVGYFRGSRRANIGWLKDVTKDLDILSVPHEGLTRFMKLCIDRDVLSAPENLQRDDDTVPTELLTDAVMAGELPFFHAPSVALEQWVRATAEHVLHLLLTYGPYKKRSNRKKRLAGFTAQYWNVYEQLHNYPREIATNTYNSHIEYAPHLCSHAATLLHYSVLVRCIRLLEQQERTELLQQIEEFGTLNGEGDTEFIQADIFCAFEELKRQQYIPRLLSLFADDHHAANADGTHMIPEAGFYVLDARKEDAMFAYMRQPHVHAVQYAVKHECTSPEAVTSTIDPISLFRIFYFEQMSGCIMREDGNVATSFHSMRDPLQPEDVPEVDFEDLQALPRRLIQFFKEHPQVREVLEVIPKEHWVFALRERGKVTILLKSKDWTADAVQLFDSDVEFSENLRERFEMHGYRYDSDSDIPDPLEGCMGVTIPFKEESVSVELLPNGKVDARKQAKQIVHRHIGRHGKLTFHDLLKLIEGATGAKVHLRSGGKELYVMTVGDNGKAETIADAVGNHASQTLETSMVYQILENTGVLEQVAEHLKKP